jgi:hypothetical protein
LYKEVTWTIGGVISGYFETGMPSMVNPPRITIKIEMTMAKMGLLIKNSLMQKFYGVVIT